MILCSRFGGVYSRGYVRGGHIRDFFCIGAIYETFCGTLPYMGQFDLERRNLLCFVCVPTPLCGTPLNGTLLYMGQLPLVPGRFTELLFVGREATKALLHLDKWDRRL